MARRKYTLDHGEGSFYQRASDGRWIGTLEAGWSATGARRRITVTDRNRDRAWDKLTAKRKQLALEGLAAATQRSITVAAWIERWLQVRSDELRPKAYTTVESQARRWIIPTLGHVRVDRLTPGDVRRLSRAILDAGRTSTTSASCQGALQQALRDARREGYEVPEAVLLVQRPRKAVSDRTAIPLDDALRLVRVATATPDGSRWIAALLQGMRQGECLGLTWDCVDMERGSVDVSWQLQALPYLDRARETFRIPHGYEVRRLTRAYHLVRPKSRRRMVPMVPWMETALAQWRATGPESPHGLVWPRPDGSPRSPRRDAAAWVALQESAAVAKGDGHYVLHEARHTAATLLLAAGVEIEIIRAILGHSDIVTTQRYQHASPEMVRAALEASARRLGIESGPTRP